MNLHNMVRHLVFPRERTITAAALAPTATTNRAPEDRLLERVRSVIVAVEIGPACEGPTAAATVYATEDEGLWVMGRFDGADLQRRDLW